MSSSSSSSSSSAAPANIYPDGQTPNCPNGCCPPGVMSNQPVQFFNGAVSLRQDDLTTPSGGLFGHARYYANQMYSGGLLTSYLGPNGYNWLCSQLPYAAVDPSGNVAIFFDPNNPYWFAPGMSGYAPLYASLNPLDVSLVSSGGILTFTQTDGGKTRVTTFNALSGSNPGMFQSYTDERGAVTSVYSSSGSQITELRRGYGGTMTESLQYAYFASGPAAGLLSTVTYNKLISGTWTPIKRAAFAMYGASDPNGSVNDLLSATQQIWDGSNWDDVAVDYYRYYIAGATKGFIHGLKSHFGPEACRLMFNAGITLSTASDSSIQQYADHIYQYDGSQRVTVEVSSVCAGCPGGGTTMDRFTYTASGNSNGFNNWNIKCQQLLPDTSQRIVYANYVGMPIVDLTIDPTGTDVWITFYRYDSNGRQIIKAYPSAVTGYNESYDDLVNYSGGGSSLLNPTSGLIENTVLYTTTGSGAVVGYPQYDQVQQGQSGTPVIVREYTYGSYLSNTVHPLASVTVYPIAGSTATAYMTSYAYTYTGDVLTQKVTQFPIVSTTQNGSGIATPDSITEQFDSTYGFPSQTTDERGIVSTFTYDPIMAVMTQQVLNYLSGSSGPGINVTTNLSYDNFGRLLTTLGDSHTVVISGTATSVQAVTSYAYNQSIQPVSGTWVPDQNTSAKGYYSGSTYTLIDPVTVMNVDKDGRVIDNITSHRTAGPTGLLSPTETFAQTDWQTWISTQYNNNHQTISTRTYFLIPSSGAGALGTNFGETDLGYDILERQNRVAVWGSTSLATITRTVWTTPQRVASTFVGTNDTGATDVNPAGTNSIQFVQAGSQVSAGSSVSVTLVNNVTAGDTLVAYGCVAATTAPGSGAVSDNLGNTWTQLKSQAGASAGAGAAGVWTAHITSAGAITVTLAAGASNCALTLAEYSGVVSASPLDASASASNSIGSTTPASGNLTTSNAGDVVLGAASSASNVAWTPASGFIQRAAAGASGAMSAAFEEQLVTATGTYDPSFTISASSAWTAIGVALKSTAPSASNNMVIVSSNVFDGGSAGGDGNLTEQTQYVSATPGDTRVTGWGYDFRDRRISMTDATSRYILWGLDNLDRTTSTQLYAVFGGSLESQTGTNYDARGRAYQNLIYSSAGTSGSVLTGNMWYDPSGNLVQQIEPGAGQVFTKRAYNGVNWVTAAYTGYNTSGASYSQAQNVTGDIIIEQSASTFDEVGTAVSTASYQRLNDASTSTTGALTSSIARITYAAAWSDGIDRQIASANYGAASSFTRPTTPPSTSSTVLVSATSFDEAGRVYQTTDPKSIVNQKTYDNAGRTTQTVEDVGGLARTTNYAYTLDNLIATMTAVNSTTGNQTTTWTNGTTLATSGVARSDLLASITFPDSVSGSDVVSFTCNRQGERLTITDQRGTIRTLYRDGLGRVTNDCVTANGTGTDVSVKQIIFAYEARGMVSLITSTDSATQGAGTVLNQVQLAYNTFAQLAQEYQSHSGAVVTTGPTPTPSVAYAYDTGGSSSNEIRFNQLTYPSGRQVAYNFGPGMDTTLNRVTSISDSTATLVSYTYLGLGTPVRISHPQPSVWLDLWGGTSGVFNGLDLFSRVIDQRWQNNTGGTPVDIDRYKYGYDFNSNRLWKANVVGTANVAAGLDEYYTMDNLNRLTDMQRGVLNGTNTGITGSPAREMTYGLDPTGNWSTYVTKTSGTTDLNQTRTSNTVNEITAIGGTPGWYTPPAYDAAGSMTTMPQPGTPASPYAATYDAWNRMTTISASGSYVGQYEYDGRNRRTVAVTATTRHVYFTDGWQDVEERLGSSTSMDKQYVWGVRYIDELVCRDDAVPERLYATQDANFNLASIVNTSGTPQERYYFDPYGNRTILNGSWTVITTSAYAWTIGHQGLIPDGETGLIYNRNRFLQPTLGAFARRDPACYDDFTNLYLVVASNPPVRLDPLGLKNVTEDDYWTAWLSKYGSGLTDMQKADAKKVLDRGCIGVTCLNLGKPAGLPNPDTSNCFTNLTKAKAAQAKMIDAKTCPCDVHLFSIHFFSNSTFASGSDPTGRVDMSPWHMKAAGPGWVNFDYGYYIGGGQWVHANHNAPGMIVTTDDTATWRRSGSSPTAASGGYWVGYTDFNHEVFCIACQRSWS